MAPRTTTKANVKLEDLDDDARTALIDELRKEQADQRAPWAPGAEPRELTARERAVRLLLRERDHMDGCPLIDDEHRSAGRVEAYTQTKPANAARGEPARDVTVIRCIECGGSRVLEGDVRTNLIEALSGDAAGASANDLDGSL